MAKCPVCSKSFANKKDLRSHVQSKHPDKFKHYYEVSQKTGKPAQRSNASGTGVGGWISNEEYLGKAAANKTTLLNICPGKSGMSRLDNYAVLYDQYKIEKWNVRFTPRVGTTVSGMYVAGIAYSHLDNPDGVADVAALAPKIHHAVWQGGNLSAAPSKLMKQKWMYVYSAKASAEDTIAGKVAIFVDGDKAEIDVWVDYAVSFTGPTTAKKEEHVLQTDGKKWTLDGTVVTTLPAGFDEGYNVDVESTNLIDSQIKSFFGFVKTLHTYTQTGLYYYHLIADQLASGYVLPVIGAPVIMHLTRQPFPAALRAIRSGLLGEAQASSAADQEVEVEGLSIAGRAPSPGGESSHSFERL